MNRPFEFRVWDKIGKRFINNFTIDKFGRVHVDYLTPRDVLLYNENHNFIIQQFTGCLDESGRKIFEGDILYTNFGEKGSKHDPFIEIRDHVTFHVTGNIMYNGEDLFWYRNTVEIIGNIFENPELLNEKQ